MTDPRPSVDASGAVLGSRCTTCAHPTLELVERCPACRAPAVPTTFARAGTVFSGTVLRIPVADRQPPISLVYVDLDDGPRVLGHGQDPEQLLHPGMRVEISDSGPAGDLRFAPADRRERRSGARQGGSTMATSFSTSSPGEVVAP